MSRDCTFGFHIRKVVVEYKNLCNWVLRVFQTREVNRNTNENSVYVSSDQKWNMAA